MKLIIYLALCSFIFFAVISNVYVSAKGDGKKNKSGKKNRSEVEKNKSKNKKGPVNEKNNRKNVDNVVSAPLRRRY